MKMSGSSQVEMSAFGDALSCDSQAYGEDALGIHGSDLGVGQLDHRAQVRCRQK
jgi:hypothetical protein